MELDKTEKLLNKFGYNFKKKNNLLIIKMDYSQQIIIDFSTPNKVIIKDKLVAWNFLTGMLEMSLKNATLYNFIETFIMTLLFIYSPYAKKIG